MAAYAGDKKLWNLKKCLIVGCSEIRSMLYFATCSESSLRKCKKLAMFLNKFLKFYNTLKDGYLSRSSKEKSSLFYFQKRQRGLFLEWFVNIFNGVDSERVKLVGFDCACAEWLLRNGASVRFKGHPNLLSDYNQLIALEETQSKILKVEEVYAKEAYLNHLGFNHFYGCDHVKKITLIFCPFLNNSALAKLEYVKNTLEYLELVSCFGIEDEGLESLTKLSNLKTLILGDLIGVKNKDACEDILRKALVQCKIDFQK